MTDPRTHFADELKAGAERARVKAETSCGGPPQPHSIRDLPPRSAAAMSRP